MVSEGGISLALALWLRSEVLLRCDRPQAALEDLKLALKERLPAKMRAQYYWRMGHCYRGQHRNLLREFVIQIVEDNILNPTSL